MPLQIIRQDITKIKCDAIVNPSNRHLFPGGGVDAKIHRKAGPELLTACALLSGIEVGEAKITPAFNLPCKYVIHTAGPVWSGGQNGEKTLLQNCYVNCLKTAMVNGCESVAIPLISSGTYGYPKDKVLKVAVKTINGFLQDNELNVYLVVYDKTSYEFSKRLYGQIERFIEDNYYDDLHCMSFMAPDDSFFNCAVTKKKYYGKEPVFGEDVSSIEKMLSEIDDNFAVTLFKLIDVKNMTDVECYKKANVSKQTWYKILNEKNYKPSKNTVIAFAISLKLTFSETQHLLSTVGFTLSKSSKFDIIIEYFIKHGSYDIMKINETLFEFDQPCLGV
ncbi:MAG: macro domain-containing protein [Clostridia bacterium]|nr:macro domain-containing protein [Clostridia bacterium]